MTPAATRGVVFAALLGCLGATPASGQNELGRLVFNARWFPKTPAESPQFQGLGPQFDAVSCVACHFAGSGGQGPVGSGVAPLALEVQLESPDTGPRTGTGAGAVGAADEPAGDPVYGSVFTTAAIQGVKAEGTVLIQYREIYGYYYPDGARWRLRAPRYQLVNLSHGPLSATTVIKPRLAPPLFGVALLERMAVTGNHFGWQLSSRSIRDQTTKAFAREMGLTSADRPGDDCTAAEADCVQRRDGTHPDVSEQQVEAVVAYVQTIGVPKSPLKFPDAPSGSSLFVSLGCDGCHVKAVPAYTDLKLHDLGDEMADEDVAGRKVVSRWRTAPLWGLGIRSEPDEKAAFLHDGRARSIEEAILWHGGEASRSRAKFVGLGPRSRRALLHWLETL